VVLCRLDKCGALCNNFFNLLLIVTPIVSWTTYSTMGLIKGVFVIVLLVLVLFELIISVSTFQLKSDTSSLSTLPLPLPLQAPLTIEYISTYYYFQIN